VFAQEALPRNKVLKKATGFAILGVRLNICGVLFEGNAEFDNTVLGFTSNNKRHNMDINIFKKSVLDITIYLHFSKAFVVNPGIVLELVKQQLDDAFHEVPCILSVILVLA
jgi:hypothetical protein